MENFKKVLLFLLCGLVFGCMVALAFVGVTKLTGVFDKTKIEVSQAAEEDEKPKSFEEMLKEEFEKRLNLKPDKKESEDAAKADKEETPAKDKVKKDFVPTPHVAIDDSSKALPNDVSGIVEEAMPSVVAITGKQQLEAFSWFGETQTYETEASGSGIIIGEDDDEYMVATNNHVVAEVKDLIVTFADDTTAPAEVKGRDAETDVAVISVKKADMEKTTAENIKIATIGEGKLKVGQGVIAIGNALGYGQSVTVGYISALDRAIHADIYDYEGLIQTDAAINPGNSGGALINMRGELIGINCAKNGQYTVEGVGYAIPITEVYDLLEDFSENEVRESVAEEERGYIGIQGQNIDEQMSSLYDMPQGVYVYKIIDGSKAKNSDLQEKDIITKIEKQGVRSLNELIGFLEKYKAGEKVTLTVMRLVDSEYKEMEIEVELTGKNEVSTKE